MISFYQLWCQRKNTKPQDLLYGVLNATHNGQYDNSAKKIWHDISVKAPRFVYGIVILELFVFNVTVKFFF